MTHEMESHYLICQLTKQSYELPSGSAANQLSSTYKGLYLFYMGVRRGQWGVNNSRHAKKCRGENSPVVRSYISANLAPKHVPWSQSINRYVHV